MHLLSIVNLNHLVVIVHNLLVLVRGNQCIFRVGAQELIWVEVRGECVLHLRLWLIDQRWKARELRMREIVRSLFVFVFLLRLFLSVETTGKKKRKSTVN